MGLARPVVGDARELEAAHHGRESEAVAATDGVDPVVAPVEAQGHAGLEPLPVPELEPATTPAHVPRRPVAVPGADGQGSVDVGVAQDRPGPPPVARALPRSSGRTASRPWSARSAARGVGGRSSANAPWNRDISSTGTAYWRLGRCRNEVWTDVIATTDLPSQVPACSRRGTSNSSGSSASPSRRRPAASACTSSSVTGVTPDLHEGQAAAARVEDLQHRLAVRAGRAQADAEVDRLAEHVAEMAPQRAGTLLDRDPVRERGVRAATQQRRDPQSLDRVRCREG